MIKLGEYQELKIVKLPSIGAFLNVGNDSDSDSNVLLPKKQVPENAAVGDIINVFIYKDSEDRLIATVNTPLIKLFEIKRLKVTAVTNIGAFINWGLEKDLLLPFREQLGKPAVDDEVLVYLYIDKSDRLCATMKISNQLIAQSTYEVDDEITGTIYSIKKEFGCFVAIDNKFDGLIPAQDVFEDYRLGDVINGRVSKIQEDGRAVISTKKKAYLQMDEDCALILKLIDENNGHIQLSDSSSPEEIKKKLSMSKKAFKRAVGKLYKDKKIEFVDEGISLIE